MRDAQRIRHDHAREWLAAERARLGLLTAEIPCPQCRWVAEGVSHDMHFAEGLALGAWARHVQEHLTIKERHDDV